VTDSLLWPGYAKALDRLVEVDPTLGWLRQLRKPIRWIGQEERWGCGCAAVAMITGQTYQQVKGFVERDFEPRGMTSGDWQLVLAELGYACQTIHRVKQYPWMNGERDVWPPTPWADVHLCEVVIPGGAGTHMVVMLADGSVLDPLTDQPKHLSDYEQVYQVAAVVPAPELPKRLFWAHRRPEMEFA